MKGPCLERDLAVIIHQCYSNICHILWEPRNRTHIPFVLQEILYMETAKSQVPDSKPPVSLVTLHHNKTAIRGKKKNKKQNGWIRIRPSCTKAKLKQCPYSLHKNIKQTAITNEAAKIVPNKQCSIQPLFC